MTPNDIEILIHCYCCPVPHPRLDAPAVKESIFQMINDGLVEADEDDDRYRATEKGRAHIRQLCNLPIPVQAWLSASGEPIPENG